jgi:hypothetical protein
MLSDSAPLTLWLESMPFQPRGDEERGSSTDQFGLLPDNRSHANSIVERERDSLARGELREPSS